MQKRRDKIIYVGDKIIDVKTDVIFGDCDLTIIDDVLIINEIQPSNEKIMHLFNKNTFEYITSAGFIGRGPGEISRYGTLAKDYNNRDFWYSDYDKTVMLKFPLDSVLNNTNFHPMEKIAFHSGGKDLSLGRFEFLNDSIILGKALRPLSHSSFDMLMAKRNLNTGNTELFGYEHPEATGKISLSRFALSVKDGIYVNCYSRIDLMTICDLEGNLKYNIYGLDKFKNRDRKVKNAFFADVQIIGEHIVASYVGGVDILYNEFKRPEGNRPSQFLVFDLDGNYKATIETGFKFDYFCIDEENDRFIAYFAERENPLGYFDFDFLEL